MIDGNAVLRLLDCVKDRLKTLGQGPVCEAIFYPGEQVGWDYCGECEGDTCGMAYVRLAQSFQYGAFPFPDLESKCGRPLADLLEIGVLRCLPAMEDDGGPIDPNLITGSAIGLLHDKQALRCVMQDCWKGEYAIGMWVPQGPMGQCVGGYWQVYVA